MVLHNIVHYQIWPLYGMCRPPGSAAVSYNVLHINAFIQTLVPLIMDHDATLSNANFYMKDTHGYIQIWVIDLRLNIISPEKVEITP